MANTERQSSSFRPLPRRIRACKHCRAAKVRCSGGRPCARCTRRSDDCLYIADEAIISVPESYLRDLQHQLSLSQTALLDAESRAEGRERSTPRPTSSMLASVSAPDASALESEMMATPGGDESTMQPGPGQAYPWTSLRLGRLVSATSADAPSSQVHTPGIPTARSWESQAIASSPSTSVECHSRSGIPQNIRPRQRCSSLAGRDFAYVSDTHSTRFLFLGPTSTWTFCRRAFILLENADSSPDTPRAPLNLDGAAFKLRWQPKSRVDGSDLQGLPAMDHALFLYNAVKFHFGELFCIIDEKDFMARFEDFHQRPLETAQNHILWFVVYLLILAFGKAFTTAQSHQTQTSRGPNGAHLAARALSLLPNIAFLQEERPALQAIRAIALAALYFHAIDMRSPAYQYIGQAVRLSFHDGLHRMMPDDVDPGVLTICNNTCYITAPSPESLSPGTMAKALGLRIRLSRLMSAICGHSYGFNHDAASDFVRNTTSVLRNLAELSQQIDQVISAYKSTGGEPPRMFHNIRLCYNHCIVIATRPLIIWLLYRVFESNHFEPQWLDGPVATLVETSAKSATMILSMLDDLVRRDSIETFLPFQLEYVFSSAILLSILDTFTSSYVPRSEWLHNVVNILDHMISKGSVVAELRKVELEHLDALLKPYRSEQSGEGPTSTTEKSNNFELRLDSSSRTVQERTVGGQSLPLAQDTDNGWWDSDAANICGGDISALALEFEHDDPSSWLLFDQLG